MKPLFRLEQNDTNISGCKWNTCPMYNKLEVQYFRTCNTTSMGDVTLAVTVKPPVYFVGQYYLLYFVHLIVTNNSIIHNS